MNDNFEHNDRENTTPQETQSSLTPPQVPEVQPNYTYEWNGAPANGRRRKSRKGIFIAVTAVVLAVLTITLSCALLFADDNGGGLFTPGSTQGTTSGGTAGEVNQTVGITEEEGETYDLKTLYEKCSVSCATIRTTVRNGYSIGSGFVITSDGYIVTNHHVIEDYVSIEVIFYDGTEYDAELIGSDDASDLAVLKIDANDLTPIELGNSDALSVGDPVVAIGTPYNISLAGTLTQGVISGVNREVTVSSGTGTKTMRLLQTDSSINPGNSGGPLLNMQGQVVGINTLKLMDKYEGIGFAIPMTNAVEIINMLIQDGEVINRPDNDYVTVSAFLNITVSEINDQTIALYRLPEDVPEGVLVVNIGSRTAAIYRAGVEVYDIITEFNGQAITSNESLKTALAACQAGDEATIKVYRISRDGSTGTELTFTFKLDAAQ